MPQLDFFEQYKKLKFIMLSLIYSFELFSPRHFTFKLRMRLKRKKTLVAKFKRRKTKEAAFTTDFTSKLNRSNASFNRTTCRFHISQANHNNWRLHRNKWSLETGGSTLSFETSLMTLGSQVGQTINLCGSLLMNKWMGRIFVLHE